MADNNANDKVYEAGQKAAQMVQGGQAGSGYSNVLEKPAVSDTANHSVFDKEGVIGKQFQADGALGSVGESIGGPLSKDGAIGKQFTTEGSVGGTVQKSLGDQEPK